MTLGVDILQDISWGCGWFLATLFVIINLLGQLGGVGMVMARFRVDIACGVLFFIVVLQVRPLAIRKVIVNVWLCNKCHFFRLSHTAYCGTCSSCSGILPLSVHSSLYSRNHEPRPNLCSPEYPLWEKISLR